MGSLPLGKATILPRLTARGRIWPSTTAVDYGICATMVRSGALAGLRWQRYDAKEGAAGDFGLAKRRDWPVGFPCPAKMLQADAETIVFEREQDGTCFTVCEHLSRAS